MWNDRAITIGGIVFVALTVPGYLLMAGGVAAGDTTTAEAASWLGESGHRTRSIVGMYLMCGGALGFTVFLAGVLGRLRASECNPILRELAGITGTIFAICQFVGAVGMATAAMSVAFDVEPLPVEASLTRLSSLGVEIWLVPGMLAASAFVGSLAVATFTSRVFPAWVGLAGVLCAAVLLAGIVFLPVFMFMLWTASVALVVLVRPQARALLPAAPNPV